MGIAVDIGLSISGYDGGRSIEGGLEMEVAG
jgi:hypothetical protein